MAEDLPEWVKIQKLERLARAEATAESPETPKGPGGRPPVNGEQSLTRDELFMRDVQPKIDDYYADLAAGEPSDAQIKNYIETHGGDWSDEEIARATGGDLTDAELNKISEQIKFDEAEIAYEDEMARTAAREPSPEVYERYLSELEKENPTVPDDGAPLDLKSIDSNSMDEIDVKIETQAKLPKGIIRSALREIPATVIVPFEQAAELGLRQLGYGGPVRKLIKYELAIFGASILWGLVGAGAKYATDIYGYQTTGVPQDKQKEPLYPEGKTPEQELTSKIDAALMGATIMSSMMKAAPSYWLDEWLLKRYPELYPSEDTPFKEGGWKTWFPQQGLVTTGAQKGLGGIRNMFGGSND